MRDSGSDLTAIEQRIEAGDESASMGWSNSEEARDALCSIRTGKWPARDAYERAGRPARARGT